MASAPKRRSWGTLALALVFLYVGILQIYNGWYAEQHHTVAPGRWASWMTPGQAYVAGFLCIGVSIYTLITLFRSRKTHRHLTNR
jgi:hypothetical protein